VVNMEPVGRELGIEYSENAKRDVFEGGRGADEVFLDLASELGWLEELAQYADHMAPKSQELLKGRLAQGA